MRQISSCDYETSSSSLSKPRSNVTSKFSKPEDKLWSRDTAEWVGHQYFNFVFEGIWRFAEQGVSQIKNRAEKPIMRAEHVRDMD